MEQDNTVLQDNKDAISQEQEGADSTAEIPNSILTFLPTSLTITHAALANIATNALHLYQMPVLKNALALSYSITNTIAYSRGTNFYLKGASFALAAGALYETYKIELVPVTQAIVSYSLFVNTPSIAHTYLSNNQLHYAQKAYILFNFAVNIHLLYEHNYGSEYLEYEIESYNAQEQLAEVILNCTRKTTTKLASIVNAFESKKETIQELIKEQMLKLRFEEWKDCPKYWSNKDFTHEQVIKICSKACDSRNDKSLTEIEMLKKCHEERMEFDTCMRMLYEINKSEAFKICTINPSEREKHLESLSTFTQCTFEQIANDLVPDSGEVYTKCKHLLEIEGGQGN